MTEEERMSQGFVTVHHNLAMLTEMATIHPHIIALHQDLLVGYALVMPKTYGRMIPELWAMFDLMETLHVNDVPLSMASYVVMGQICIAKEARGLGVFSRLYQKMKEEMSPYYEYIVTEISTSNTRSIAAHRKVGFQTIHTYFDTQNGDHWHVVAMPTR